MCGVAGVLSYRSGFAEFGPVLNRLQQALRHRGPDDSGLFISCAAGSASWIKGGRLFPDSRCGLVHTRLEIIGLGPAGHQPMSTPDGRFTIVFNGEIYNFRALRSRLEQAGVQFRSSSDTEVLLYLYQQLGRDCVKELRGMFAFAIWDEAELSCFLARDSFGIKPLYYAEVPNGLVFASELRAVLASGLVERRLDPAAVSDYFEMGSVPEPATLVEGVHCLPAGATMIWRAGAISVTPPPPLTFRDRGMSPSEVVPYVREALLDSMRHHFVSDVPVGVFLSGGIDSTALVALSRVLGLQDLRTFSISFDDPRFNEGDVSERTAHHFCTTHADLRLHSGTGRDLLQQFLTSLDQPSIDGFNTFTVSKFAHDQGMKVVLSGLGGDELFGGYPSFHRVPQLVRLARRLGPMRSMVGKLAGFSATSKFRRLADFLSQPPDIESAYRAYRAIYPQAEALNLAAHYTTDQPANLAPTSVPGLSTLPTPEDEVSLLELTRYMRNQLLRDGDVMSMAWGLELRVPFVDRVLVESLAQIPARTRLQPGKKLLLEAVPEVPEWVWNRPKRGFVFPLEEWVNGDWRDVFEAAVRRSGARAHTWYQKWSVFALENWCANNKIDLPLFIKPGI